VKRRKLSKKLISTLGTLVAIPIIIAFLTGLMNPLKTDINTFFRPTSSTVEGVVYKGDSGPPGFNGTQDPPGIKGDIINFPISIRKGNVALFDGVVQSIANCPSGEKVMGGGFKIIGIGIILNSYPKENSWVVTGFDPYSLNTTIPMGLTSINNENSSIQAFVECLKLENKTQIE
jgi:hypothetical protein